jgi:hypothetical protein
VIAISTGASIGSVRGTVIGTLNTR